MPGFSTFTVGPALPEPRPSQSPLRGWEGEPLTGHPAEGLQLHWSPDRCKHCTRDRWTSAPRDTRGHAPASLWWQYGHQRISVCVSVKDTSSCNVCTDSLTLGSRTAACLTRPKPCHGLLTPRTPDGTPVLLWGPFQQWCLQRENTKIQQTQRPTDCEEDPYLWLSHEEKAERTGLAGKWPRFRLSSPPRGPESTASAGLGSQTDGSVDPGPRGRAGTGSEARAPRVRSARIFARLLRWSRERLEGGLRRQTDASSCPRVRVRETAVGCVWPEGP